MKREQLFKIGENNYDFELIFCNKRKAAKTFSQGNKPLYKLLIKAYEKRIPTIGSNPGINKLPQVTFLYHDDDLYSTTIMYNAFNLGLIICLGKSLAGQSFLKIKCPTNDTEKFLSLSNCLDKKTAVLPEVLDLVKRLVDEIYLDDGTVFQVILRDSLHLDIITDIDNFSDIMADLQFNIYDSYNLVKYELITDNPEEVIYKLQVIKNRTK